MAGFHEGANKFGPIYFVDFVHRLVLTSNVLRDGGQRPYMNCCQGLINHHQSRTHWYGHSSNEGGANGALAPGTINLGTQY